MTWKGKEGNESFHFDQIDGHKTPTKFEVGGIIVWENDTEYSTCVVVSTCVPNTKKGFANITLIEHGTNVKFQPLLGEVKSYGKNLTAPFKKGLKLYFFDPNFVLPLEFEVMQDVQKSNKEGVFSVFVREKRRKDLPEDSNTDSYVEILTLSLHGLVLNQKENKKKRKINYSRGYSGGYNKGGATTLGSPSPEIIILTLTLTLTNPITLTLDSFIFTPYHLMNHFQVSNHFHIGSNYFDSNHLRSWMCVAFRGGKRWR